MNIIFKTILLVAGIALLTSACSAGLTEEMVQQLVSQADHAVSSKNANEIAELMSDKVEIVVHSNEQGKSQVQKLSKKEYIALLQVMWVAAENYKYTRSGLSIKMQGKQAVVTARINETMIIQGQTVSGETEEESVVELENNKPRFVKITAHSRM